MGAQIVRVFFRELRKHIGKIRRKLAKQDESKVEEGDLMPDHVPMILSITPKYAVGQGIGYIKGKSAVHLVCM